MVAQFRSQRFLPPTRGTSLTDLEEKTTKPMRTRASSPSSVRCFVDEKPKSSLASSIKKTDSLPSRDASITNRKVGFSEWVGVKDTISVSDMTDEEIESYWLQEDEYSRIRRRNRLLIRRAEAFKFLSGKPLPPSHSECYDDCEDDIERKTDGDYLCMRGLESATKSENMRKKTCRRNSIQQVLVEQEFQSVQGLRDDDAIAEVYMEVTTPCKFRAVHLAMEDRIAAAEQ